MTCIVANLLLLAFIGGFKEAWGYSRTGYDGIWVFLPKKFDHAIWIAERAFIVFLMGFSFRFLGDLYELLVMAGYYTLSFSLCHTVAYNWTMKKLKVSGYNKILADQWSTTARFDPRLWLEITAFAVAQIGLVLFKIYYS
jgi:hypothetical protein